MWHTNGGGLRCPSVLDLQRRLWWICWAWLIHVQDRRIKLNELHRTCRGMYRWGHGRAVQGVCQPAILCHPFLYTSIGLWLTHMFFHHPNRSCVAEHAEREVRGGWRMHGDVADGRKGRRGPVTITAVCSSSSVVVVVQRSRCFYIDLIE